MILSYDNIDYDIGCAQYPAKFAVDIVQVKEKSASGIIYREDFSVATNNITYRFEDMETLNYQMLMNFFLNIVNGMMEQFVLKDDTGYSIACHFADPKLSFTKTSFELWAGTFSVERAG